MTTHEQAVIEKLRQLPPQRRLEVEAFIDFLHQREYERQLTQSATTASEPAFSRVWDNPDDAAYDQL